MSFLLKHRWPRLWAARKVAIPAVGLLTGIAVASVVGRTLHPRHVHAAMHWAKLIGMILLAAGPFFPPRRIRTIGIALALLLYVIVMVTVDPLAFIWDMRGGLKVVAWLSPTILGGVVLPVRGKWAAGIGCWCVLFAGVAGLFYNVIHGESGVSFLMRWAE